MARSEFLQIRVSPDDKKRIKQVAKADHLDASTWARRAVLKAVERWEATQSLEQEKRKKGTE